MLIWFLHRQRSKRHVLVLPQWWQHWRPQVAAWCPQSSPSSPDPPEWSDKRLRGMAPSSAFLSAKTENIKYIHSKAAYLRVFQAKIQCRWCFQGYLITSKELCIVLKDSLIFNVNYNPWSCRFHTYLYDLIHADATNNCHDLKTNYATTTSRS